MARTNHPRRPRLTEGRRLQMMRRMCLGHLITGRHGFSTARNLTKDGDLQNHLDSLIAEVNWLSCALRKEWGFKPTEIEDETE